MNNIEFDQEFLANSQVLAELNITPRSLHSDDAPEGFHIRAGDSHSQDHGIVLDTRPNASSLRMIWDAHFTIYPHSPDGDRAVIYVTGSGEVFENSINSYIELDTNLGELKPGPRGLQLDDGRFVFIVDDLSAPDEPFLQVITVNNAQNVGQSWDMERIKVEFHKRSP